MLNINFDTLDTGGYCFGDDMYIRTMLHNRINEDLMVLSARKMGINAPKSALVILYNGRNITDPLISILISEDMAIKSENKELIFLRKSKENEWDFYDLKEIDRDSLDLHQNLHDLEITLKECLQKCNSFKGKINDIKVVDSAYGEAWYWKTKKYFCVFHKRRNITSSLIKKLLELELLYEDGGRYMSITDKDVSVGFDYRFKTLIRDIFLYFVPLTLITGVLLIFNSIIAILVLVVGIAYFIMNKRLEKLPKAEREKVKLTKQIIIYIIKWTVILAICIPIAISLLGVIGLIVPVVMVAFALYRYKKIFK